MRNIHGIVLSEDETVVREYEASYIESPKTEGYLVATNRRLIFTGSAKSMMGNSMIVRETKIDDVSGVMSQLYRGKNIGKIIMGIILAIAGLISLFAGGFMVVLGLVLMAIGGYLLYKAFTLAGMEMYLSILTSGQSSSAIQVAVEAKSSILTRFGLGGSHAWMSVAASGPGRNTEQMIREIGALVQDIQVMGDLAIDKWVNEPFVNSPVNQPASAEDNFKQLSSSINKVKEKAVTAGSNISQQVQEKKAEFRTNSTPVSSDADQCECGSLIQPGSAFCGECGKPVNQASKEESFFG